MNNDEITSSVNGEEEVIDVYISDAKTEKLQKREQFLKEVISNSLFLLAVLVITLIIVKYVGQRTVVVGESMMPTLQNGDNLIVDKISYKVGEPERFDIIVFPYEYEANTFYIKRIIGLPGETVKIDFEGNIYINGSLLSENYGAEVILDPGQAWNSIVLGEDEYFVLGDNRNHSSDSRNPAVGVINKKDIIGRAWLRIYPFKSFGFVKDHN